MTPPVPDHLAAPATGFALVPADGERAWQGAALDAAVDELIRCCDDAGTRPGELLALGATDPARLALGLVCAARRGLAVLPLPPHLAESERHELLAVTGAEWFLPADRPPEATGCASCRPQGDTGLRLLVATSGSSGAARVVMLGADNLAAAAAAANARLELRRGDAWLSCLSPHHIGGIAPLFRCARAGAVLVTLRRFEPQAFVAALHRHRITHTSLVPAMLGRLLDLGLAPPSTLRVALVGGQALDPGLARAAHGAGWPVWVTYGLSEAASQVASAGGPAAGTRPGLVGAPLDGVQVRAGTPARPAPLALRGPMLMRGYANPERRPGEGLRDGWLVTGDLGYLATDGVGPPQLVLLGRADEVLISGGVKIAPTRVEAALSACPGIGEVALTALPDPRWGDRLVALYTGPAPAAQIRDWCSDHLPAAQRPRELVAVAALPLCGPGKLDRQRLRELALRAAHGPQAVTTPT